MTQQIRKEIARLKNELDAVKPKPLKTVVLLGRPTPEMGRQAMNDFEKELAEAKANSFDVIVLCALGGHEGERPGAVSPKAISDAMRSAWMK